MERIIFQDSSIFQYNVLLTIKMIHTLYIISTWQQAQEIQTNLLRLVPKSPIIQNEWYKEQGMIEWHDATHSQWKKNIQKHMQVKRGMQFIDSQGILYLVIWNAQVVPQSYWDLWKDMSGYIVVVCISTNMIPRLRQLGFCVKYYPVVHKTFPTIRKILYEFIETSDWKLIVDFRNRLMDYLEWNESIYDLRSFLCRESMDVLKQYSCLDVDTMGVVQRDIVNPLSNTTNPIQCMFRSERMLILLLSIVKQRQCKE